ncbi:uncharacterized protein N7459_007237 [Penicillium hispanicum]|uniref:uncharacterized protein n=1 Tax=Penicillium hispanicum TaxID=1080232 RepID=UPI002540BE33|nr:uncharacterized protein N7459_007237 [Penicillium hispanicum]KAJ5578273.1 hypothetical protein N7459_007237 [Penicillium hispanicum]
MHYLSTRIPLLLTAWAAIVAAQDVTSTAASAGSTAGSGLCASQQVVDSCISIMKNSLDKCTSADWDCKCSGVANIANCYVDCPDDPERFSAELQSEKVCATANAYDKGVSSVPTTWSTPSAEAEATATEASVTLETSSGTAGPTKSRGIEDATKPSKGAAAGKTAGSWLALLGLGLGVVF